MVESEQELSVAAGLYRIAEALDRIAEAIDRRTAAEVDVDDAAAIRARLAAGVLARVPEVDVDGPIVGPVLDVIAQAMADLRRGAMA